MTSTRALLALFLRQELLWQHKGELLGKLWLLLQPMAYIFIFMTIFSQIMGMKLTMAINANLPATYAYSIYLVSGLLAWQLFANSLQHMAGVYQQKAAIIRKVPVSLRWLPLYVPLAELLPYTIGMILFSVYLLALGYPPGWQHLWLFPIIGLLLLLSYAMGLIFASLSVFIPDIRRALSLLLQLTFWGTPIVYVANILPEWAGLLVAINPVYWGIEALQSIYLQQPIPYQQLIWLALLDLLLLVFALWLNRRLESDIRDLL